MKQIINSILAFVITFSPLAAHTQQAQSSEGIRASEYEKAVGNVVYSLETLPQVLDELRIADMQADRAVTKTTAEAIYTRLSTALELIHVVAADRTMTEAQKDAVQKPLFVHIGQAMYTLLRQHGSDRVQSGRTIDPLPGLSQDGIMEMLKSSPGVLWNRVGLAMKELLLDAKSLGTFVQSGELKKAAANDPALVARINADDARRVEIEQIVGNLEKEQKNEATSAARKAEITREIQALAPEIKALNERKEADVRFFKKQWKPLERIYRVKAGERVIDAFGRYSEEWAPKMIEGSEAQQKYMKFFAERNIPKMITLRENRIGAQLATKYFVYGMAVASFITPDFIGMVEGRSDWSRPVTFLIEATVLITLGKMKSMTVGTKIVRELNELLSIMNGWSRYIQIDRSTGIAAGLKRKLNELQRSTVRATNTILAPTGFAVGASCPRLFG